MGSVLVLFLYRTSSHDLIHDPLSLLLFELQPQWLEEEQRQGAVVEVVGGRPLGTEDEHLVHLVLGR